MKVFVTYKATCEPVMTLYNVRKIERDETTGKKYATLYFDRDEENDITILSPLTWNLNKYSLLIDMD